uniref:TSA: Wollemia nobilis Ref_Wollemi_Transcript_1339_1690 transcribed RNA sequence n=1 Tax=Wollemia nobilis TaxID=56998 RepID=A0A0C9SB09_9CONI
MGLEIPAGEKGEDQQQLAEGLLSSRPSIFIVGSPNVGKRAILSRLLSLQSEENAISSSEITCHGWSIDTKYYTADVCVWLAHLGEKTAGSARSLSTHCDALVMVFDLSNSSSFDILQDWISGIEMQKFEILLCVGNKADLLPGHFAHAEYRRQIQIRGESSSDPHPEFWDYGIHRSEGSSLLNDDKEPSDGVQRSVTEWCNQNNIEYIEACAINDAFDKCMSINGDSQGVKRIREALSAHMWPGMVMKSQSKSLGLPLPPKKDDFSDDDSEYEIEYELLSNGSAEPWDGIEEPWVAFNNDKHNVLVREEGENKNGLHDLPVEQPSNIQVEEQNVTPSNAPQGEGLVSQNSVSFVQDDNKSEATTSLTSIITGQDPSKAQGTEQGVEDPETREKREYSFEELEQLMHEMARMRENLRLMPDSHRKEMAANLAMKMASLFADDEDDDSDGV